ncbi:MAG TPA: phage Gp37/Gp68 family protein, partial [Nevskia sp.]|nr:phage Gp37/Gp68 family protein [Nevskia sp.]
DKSSIEWTDATWNPTRGCSKVNDECLNCYAMEIAHRFSGAGQPYEGLTRELAGRGEWNGIVRAVPEKLEQVINWSAPRLIFVDSMSDLFHDQVTFEYVDKVFGMMAMAHQHCFQVLTKRPARMLEYMRSRRAQWIHEAAKGQLGYHHPKRRAVNDWPLPNVWLGVSAGRRKSYDEFVPLLRQVPAAVRFISAEPLLEELGQLDLAGIDWLIAGGESGRRARPSHPDWFRSLRDQCAGAGVPFLFKQWGEWAPGEIYPIADGARDGTPGVIELVNERAAFAGMSDRREGQWLRRVGKKAAGRLLDGVEHNGFPEPRQ